MYALDRMRVSESAPLKTRGGRIVCLAIAALASAGCPEGASSGPPTAPTASTALEFSVSPILTQRVRQGESTTYTVTVQSKGNINAGVQFEMVDLHPALTATFATSRLASTQQSTQLTISTSTSTPLAPYMLTIRGRVLANGQVASSGPPDTIVFLDVIAGATGFNLVCDAEVRVSGSGTTFTCRVVRDPGFTETVELSFAPFPEFLTVDPLRVSLDPSITSGFAFVASRGQGTPPPSYDLTVIGRSAGLTRQITVRLVFNAL